MSQHRNAIIVSSIVAARQAINAVIATQQDKAGGCLP